MEHATARHVKEISNFDNQPDSAYVRVDTVSALRGCSRATTWRHAKLGLLPAPKKLSPGITAWNVGELRAHLKAVGNTSTVAAQGARHEL